MHAASHANWCQSLKHTSISKAYIFCRVIKTFIFLKWDDFIFKAEILYRAPATLPKHYAAESTENLSKNFKKEEKKEKKKKFLKMFFLYLYVMTMIETNSTNVI